MDAIIGLMNSLLIIVLRLSLRLRPRLSVVVLLQYLHDVVLEEQTSLDKGVSVDFTIYHDVLLEGFFVLDVNLKFLLQHDPVNVVLDLMDDAFDDRFGLVVGIIEVILVDFMELVALRLVLLILFPELFEVVFDCLAALNECFLIEVAFLVRDCS